MSVFNAFVRYLFTVREFVAPSYRPERHYMRGPGPACARRSSMTIGQQPTFQ